MRTRPATVAVFGVLLCLSGCLSEQALEIACSADDDCGGVCVRGVCLSEERADEGCGAGSRWCDGACVDVLSTVSRCGACDHACPATAWELAACVDGVCETTCTADADVDADGSCRAPCVPAADGVERCNGVDDDCDGAIDEADDDLVMPSCGRDGVCASIPRRCDEGVERCDDDVRAAEPTWAATETRCDALDNDCDGETDEGCCPDAPWITLAEGPHRIVHVHADDDGVSLTALAVQGDGRLLRVRFTGPSATALTSDGTSTAPCPPPSRAVTVDRIDGADGALLTACAGDGGVELVRTSATGDTVWTLPLDRLPTRISAADDDRGLVVAIASDDGARVLRVDGEGVAPRDLTTDAIPPDAVLTTRTLDGAAVVVAASAEARRVVWFEASPGGQVAAVEAVTAAGARPILTATQPPLAAVVDALGVLQVWQLEPVDGRPTLAPLMELNAGTVDDVAAIAWRDGEELPSATSSTGVVVPPTATGEGFGVPVDVADLRVLDVRAVVQGGEVDLIVAGPDGLHAGRFDRRGVRRCDPGVDLP